MKSPSAKCKRLKTTEIPDRSLVLAKLAEAKPTVVETRAPVRQSNWEHALTCPLPRSISYEFLETLSTDVLEYLEWITHTLILCNYEKSLREIQRAADRLTRLTAMKPMALEKGLEEVRLVMSDEVPF